MNPNPTLHQNGVSAFVKSESFSRRIEFSVLVLVDIVFLFFSAWHREEIVCIYICMYFEDAFCTDIISI